MAFSEQGHSTCYNDVIIQLYGHIVFIVEKNMNGSLYRKTMYVVILTKQKLVSLLLEISYAWTHSYTMCIII